MRIIICNRDSEFGVASVVRSDIIRLANNPKVTEIIVISPKELTTNISKVKYIKLDNVGEYFVTKIPFFYINAGIILKRIYNADTDTIYSHTPVLPPKNAKIISIIHGVHYLMAMTMFNQGLRYWPFALIQLMFSIFDLLPLIYSKKIFYVSKKTADFIDKLGITSKAEFLPNIVDREVFYRRPIRESLNMFGLSSKYKYLLYVGRLDPQKGLLVLIDAFQTIQKQHPEFRLLIAGDGPLKVDVTNISKMYKKIIYLGKVNHAKLPYLYSVASISILPSYYENFPVTICEAIACDSLVIASNVGDIDMMISQECIYSPNNPLMLVSYIKRIICMSKSKSSAIKAFNINTMNQLTKYYHKSLSTF